MIKISSRPSKKTQPLGVSQLGEGAGGSMTFPVVIGLAGLGSVYASKGMEEGNGKVVAKVLGFAAVGYSVYSVLSSFGSDVSANEGEPKRPFDISNESAFGMVSGAFTYPAQGMDVSYDMFAGGYRSEILFSNPSTKNVDVVYQILASERPSYLWGLDSNFWTEKSGQVASGNVKIPAGDQRTVEVKLPLLTTIASLADYLRIRLKLQVRRSAADEWKTLSEIGFRYQRLFGKS